MFSHEKHRNLDEFRLRSTGTQGCQILSAVRMKMVTLVFPRIFGIAVFMAREGLCRLSVLPGILLEAGLRPKP